MIRMLRVAILSTVLATTHPIIMRNNALMSKMVSQFQGKEGRPEERNAEDIQPAADEEIEEEQESNTAHVLLLMQKVLCKNFPSVPCELIKQDDALKTLIERSIQQLKYKKMTMERSTSAPNYQLTLFPVFNSEDLSNFLQVSNTGMLKQNKVRKKNKQKRNGAEKNHWSQEQRNKSSTAVINGRKKIRKFYPHKYKDKGNKKKDMHDYSDERLSMSVETPLDRSTGVMRKHFSYRGEPSDPPVWRIDYMKHGEPSLNMFGYEADLKGKLIKTAPSVVDDNVLEQSARRDVLHPDVYIKKNHFNRKRDRESGSID